MEELMEISARQELPEFGLNIKEDVEAGFFVRKITILFVELMGRLMEIPVWQELLV